MAIRFLGAALLLSLIASYASAAALVFVNCPAKPLEWIRPVRPLGLRATMQVEVPPGGAEALRDAFRPYAARHDLLLQTRGYSDQWRDLPPTMLIETKLQGVIIKIEVSEGLGAADIEMHTTCYADEEWQPHWQELKRFVAASNYRILSLNDSAGGDDSAGSSDPVETIDVRPLLSLPPLAPINTQQ